MINITYEICGTEEILVINNDDDHVKLHIFESSNTNGVIDLKQELKSNMNSTSVFCSIIKYELL